MSTKGPAAPIRPTESGSPSAVILFGLAAGYFVLRIVLAFAQPTDSLGFGHDSGYLSIVANNLVNGRGFVNDAHWLVFLNPPALPIPYHNGGPLYPLVAAGTALLTGVPVERAAFLASAIAGALLVLAVALLVRPYCTTWPSALILGFVAALFEPVLLQSFSLGAQTLSLLFLVGFLALAVRYGPWAPFAAGVLLGLAWLARSDSVLAVPSVITYWGLRDGLRATVAKTVIVMSTALVTASPWLAHTNAVWGGPFWSDSAYYLLQDWHAAHMGGIDVAQYWHSVEAPAGLGAVALSRPIEFGVFTLKGIPVVIWKTLGHWSFGRLWIAVPFAIAGAVGLGGLWRTRRKEFVSLSVLGMSYVGIFSIRPFTFETRYLSLLAVMFAVIVSAGFTELVARGRKSTVMRRTALVAPAIGLICLVVPAASEVVAILRQNDSLVTYRSFAAAVSAENRSGTAVVVGSLPYFYTQATGQGSLSIPFSSDDYLLTYMTKFRAELVALTAEEAEYWRPAWIDPTRVPPWLTRIPSLPGFVYRRVPGR